MTTTSTSTSTSTSTTTTSTSTSTTTTTSMTTTSTTTILTSTTTARVFKLEVTSISINNGDQYEIPINPNDITFKSTNTDVAVVSPKGIVTAVGKGEAIINIIDTDYNVIQLKVSVKLNYTYNLGDVNNDGQINAVDASSVLAFYARISTNQEGGYDESQKLAADVNHDDQIDAVDASKILAYYAYVSTDGTMRFDDYLINPPLTTTTTATSTYPSNLVPGTVPFSINDISQYKDSPYAIVNNNIPFFDVQNFTTVPFEYYSQLDNLGRCGICMACVGSEIMPTEPRGEIGNVMPSGWHTVRYDDIIEDKYLYNRCHLIAYQLTGENANVCNLITGTRYLNTEGMLPFENKTANYVLSTNNHVIYRVTPIFLENELICRGVLMEASSLEDNGNGICFNVFCYNVQPGIDINYANGESKAAIVTTTTTTTTTTATTTTTTTTYKVTTTAIKTTTKTTTAKPVVTTAYSQSSAQYVANTNSHIFHYASCASVKRMNESNKWYFYGTRNELINAGYTPCQKCNP